MVTLLGIILGAIEIIFLGQPLTFQHTGLSFWATFYILGLPYTSSAEASLNVSSDIFLAPQRAKLRRRFATPRVIFALILREMSTRYGKSPGGYLWAILEPLGAIMILSLGFSLLMRTPSLGTSFILFYASGYLPFSLYNAIQNTTSRAINFSKQLLSYPAVTWLDAIIARFVLNFLTNLMVTYLLLTGILVMVDAHAVLRMGPLIEALCFAALLGLGIGAMNCLLVGLFPVWEMIWSIVTRPLFLASGVLFIYEDLPRLAQNILWYNPLMHVTGLMRAGIYPSYEAPYVSIVYMLTVALLSLALGLLLLGRYHREVMKA